MLSESCLLKHELLIWSTAFYQAAYYEVCSFILAFQSLKDYEIEWKDKYCLQKVFELIFRKD